VNWFGLHLYWGRENNLESILLISPVADLYLSFRMQECRPPSPQDVGMILPFMGDGILICLRISNPTRQLCKYINCTLVWCIHSILPLLSLPLLK
jgi:hypothetical protein